MTSNAQISLGRDAVALSNLAARFSRGGVDASNATDGSTSASAATSRTERRLQVEAAFHTARWRSDAPAVPEIATLREASRASARRRCGCYLRPMALVNVVVVSYNNRSELRGCVAELSLVPDVRVTVVDNASADGTPDVVADLDVAVFRLDQNRGFAQGCNVGWQSDTSPFVLFMNPDARIDEASLKKLVHVAETDGVGAVAPRIVNAEGELEFSLRRFPRLRSTYAQALFLHRLAPTAAWADESVREPEAYTCPGSPEWVSGACVLVRRDALTKIGGLDEEFFMYSEDTDLCRRLRDAGFDIRFEPAAVCVHHGGRSAPRAELLPVLATSRVRYARLHYGAVEAFLQHAGIALGMLTHMALSARGAASRAGYRRAFRAVLPLPERPSRTARNEAPERT